MIRQKVVALLKHFDECCNHWYDHNHFRKLHEINADIAREYERSIYDFEVYLSFPPKIQFNIRCHPYMKHLVLYQCDNKFEKTIAYVQSNIDKKNQLILDYKLLDIFDLPENN